GIRYVCDTLALNLDRVISEKPLNQSTTKAACEYIKSAKPTLLNIVYDEPDHAGHVAGHDTPQYYAKLHELDSCVAEIVQATKEAGIYDNSIIIVTADHGGIGKGHGGKTMQEMETPFIILGKGIRKGGNEIPESMMQFDVAPTIARIFGLETPQVWIGRPVLSIFE
nr:alkaline phosphatase [Muribaculaceae bacterium]